MAVDVEMSLSERNDRKIKLMVKYPNYPEYFIDALTMKVPYEEIIMLIDKEKNEYIEKMIDENRPGFTGKNAIMWKVENETKIRDQFASKETELKLKLEEIRNKRLLQEATLTKFKYKKSLKERDLAHTFFIFTGKKKRLRAAIEDFERQIKKQEGVVSSYDLLMSETSEQLGKHIGAMNEEIKKLDVVYEEKQEEELKAYVLRRYDLELGQYDECTEEIYNLIQEEKEEKARLEKEEKERIKREKEEKKKREAEERKAKAKAAVKEIINGEGVSEEAPASSGGFSIKAAEDKKIRVNRFSQNQSNDK